MNMEHTQIDTQNQQQVLAYELIANTNSSFFLTGRAGTGKTTFLRFRWRCARQERAGS